MPSSESGPLVPENKLLAALSARCYKRLVPMNMTGCSETMVRLLVESSDSRGAFVTSGRIKSPTSLNPCCPV